jgi:hypothetical protein
MLLLFPIRSPRKPPQDLAGNSPCFYQGNPRDSSKVMVLEELMALVLCTKSIGQWPFTFTYQNNKYLQHDAIYSQCTCSYL